MINAEITKVLSNVVDFEVYLETDAASLMFLLNIQSLTLDQLSLVPEQKDSCCNRHSLGTLVG